MARFVKPLLGMVPPDIGGVDPRGILALAGARARIRGSCRSSEQSAFVQLMTMSALDFLDQWFETDPLKATMAASGIIGTFLGIRSPGTAYVLLHHYMGEIDGEFRAWGLPARRHGRDQRARSRARPARRAPRSAPRPPVARILTRDGRATGVVLESGEEIAARHVLSSVDARRTLLDLLEPGALDAERRPTSAVSATAARRARSTSRSTRLPIVHAPARRRRASPRRDLDLALDRVHGARLRRREVRPLQRAARTSTWVIPTLLDPSMAPPGKHVMSCFVQYAPYELAPELGGWDDQREAFGDTVVTRSPSSRRTCPRRSSAARC